MLQNLKSIVAIVIFCIFLLIFNSVYIISEWQYALVFQFGEVVCTKEKPGMHFKIPFVQDIKYFEKRIIDVGVEEKELTASDGKRIIVNAVAYFKIIDPKKFFSTVNNHEGISIRLNRILESSMREIIGKVPLDTLLSSQRSILMQKIWKVLDDQARFFGVEVVDVRIVKADLPQSNSKAIFKRMQTEREKEAKRIRAEGIEEAAFIKSKADKDKSVILSDAYMKSQIIKGQGDAEAAKTYNNTYSKDIEFFNFYSTIQTYKKSLGEKNSIILSSDSKFLEYLNLDKK